MKYTIEFFEGKVRTGLFTKEKRYYFRIRHVNGNIIVWSEGYYNRTDRDRIAYNLIASIEDARYEYKEV